MGRTILSNISKGANVISAIFSLKFVICDINSSTIHISAERTIHLEKSKNEKARFV